MRARRKKSYQARREARAQRFWAREVDPKLQRAFDHGVAKGRALGRQDAERALTHVVPLPVDHRLGQRRIVDLDDILRGEKTRMVRIPTRPNELSAEMIPVAFEQVQYGCNVNETSVRWLGWQPSDMRMRGDLVMFPMRLAEQVVDMVQELRSRFRFGYGQHKPQCEFCWSMDRYLEGFVSHLERQGVVVDVARRPGRYVAPADDSMLRWAEQGGWR